MTSRRWLHDASASVADLGVLAPIAIALMIGNGFDAGTILVGAGALYLAAGLYFRVPVPVQPIKAAAAIAIALRIPAETLALAGVLLGLALVLIAATGASKLLVKAFAPPIVRGLQLGVGAILVKTAIDMASTGQRTSLIVAGAVALVLIVAGRSGRRYPAALAVVVGAVAYSLSSGQAPSFDLALWQPELNEQLFDLAAIGSALVLLVIPQIPLTLGNAVVAVVDLEHRYFPLEAKKVDARSISYSAGIANVLTGAFTGMPMCHGSGGLTAHYRAGARSHRMNIIIGSTLLAVGLFLGPTALAALAMIPLPVLAGFLAFTGFFHSSLAMSLRGADLAIAVVMGLIGVITTNLALSLGAGLALYWPLTYLGGRRAVAPVRN